MINYLHLLSFATDLFSNLVVHTIVRADILLCWIWIVLSGIVAQHLGHPGQFSMINCSNFPEPTSVQTYLSPFWILLVQQVYMYFRGSGKAAEMKRDATRGAMRAAF